MSTTTNPFPDVETPVGAAEVSEWCDLNYPGDEFRCITGEQHAVGPHFVEAHAVQEPTGRVVEACVRAQVDIWDMNHYHHYDTMLSPDAARSKADALRADAVRLLKLADAFDHSAGDVERWSGQ